MLYYNRFLIRVFTIIIFISVIFTQPLLAAETSQEKSEIKIPSQSPELMSVRPSNEVFGDDIIYPDDMWGLPLLYMLKQGPRYLDKDMPINLPPPPSNNSLETYYELLQLQELQAARTAENVYKIRQENDHLDLYGDTLGPNTIKFISETFGDVNYITLKEKFYYKRARPTQLNKSLQTVIPVPQHASYPSGHATQSFYVAYLLGQLDPVNARRYYDRAYGVAYRREIAGVHYPSDSRAGQLLATILFDKFMEVPELKDLYRKAQQEWGIMEEDTK